MKISQIKPYNTSFQAKRDDYITKKMLKSSKRGPKVIHNALVSSVATATIVGMNTILKENGITYCNVDDKTVHAAVGYNGGFYSMKFKTDLNPGMLKMLFAQSLADNNILALGGFPNYKAMIKDIKRQDIVQKGLQLHTYELNTSIQPDIANSVAESLSNLSKKYIRPKDLFYVDTDAYYYDRLDKTAYSITTNIQAYQNIQPTFRVCRFITDENGNAIGYSLQAGDIYQQRRTEKIYTEQQEPSYKIPDIADSRSNKTFAEAFRFGNSQNFNVKLKRSSETVLNHLEKHIGVKNPLSKQLKLTKFYDKNENIITRICYYDPTTGRTVVYNDDGKYLYQLEYIKDSNGNITSCNKY